MATKKDIDSLQKAVGDAYEAYAQAQAKLDEALTSAPTEEAAPDTAPASEAPPVVQA